MADAARSLDAMEADSGVELTELKVDGGMVFNELLMQFQADVLGVPVIRPKVAETTALGRRVRGRPGGGFWASIEDLRANWGKDKEWTPPMDAADARRAVRACGRRPSRAPSTGWTDDAFGPAVEARRRRPERPDRRAEATMTERTPDEEHEHQGDFAEGPGSRGAHPEREHRRRLRRGPGGRGPPVRAAPSTRALRRGRGRRGAPRDGR